MKIIQIVTQMEAGGAQKVASLLTDGLRRRGHDAQTWFLYKKRPAYDESVYVRVLYPRKPKVSEVAELSWRVWKELRREKPDAVITHTHSANAFAAPIAAVARVPVRVAVHHNPIETYSLPMRIADQCAFTTGCYSKIVTVSGGVSTSFAGHREAYRKRLHRIYNAIGPSAPSSDDIRACYSIPADLKVLVNVGRLAAQKNQVLLLQMLQRIPQGFLLLVGAGELRQELLARATVLGVASRVTFTGEVPAAQVAAILRQADLFLLPSRYESFCLAAVEAMHCGVPVVASDLLCLREVLGDSQLYFPLDDLAELTRKVQYLLNHREQCMRMAAAGRLQAKRFTLGRMVGEYEALLTEAWMYARPASGLAPNDLRRRESHRGVACVHDHL